MVTCAVYQILTLVFKVAILSTVVACYLGVSIYQAINESNVEPGRWLAGVLVIFFMACLVAHSQHTEATYRFEHTLLPQPREYVGKFATRSLVEFAARKENPRGIAAADDSAVTDQKLK